MGDASPTRAGMGLPAEDPGAKRASSVYGVRSYTVRVYCVSVAASGVGRIDSDPSSDDPMYWPSPRPTPGCGPRTFGIEARPLPERTKIFVASLLNSTPVGYQPVGMKPRTRLDPGLEMS